MGEIKKALISSSGGEINSLTAVVLFLHPTRKEKKRHIKHHYTLLIITPWTRDRAYFYPELEWAII